MASSENPAYAGPEGGGETSSEVDIEVALKDGTLSHDQALVLMQRQMEAKVSKLEASLQELQSGVGGPLEAGARSLIQRLSEAPPNLHQYTVFLAADIKEEAAQTARLPCMMFAGFSMVLVQAAVTVGVLVGTAVPTCTTSDQCDPGLYCHVGGRQRCNYCGSAGPPTGTQIIDGKECDGAQNDWCSERYNYSGLMETCRDPGPLSLDLISWCETCIRTIDGTVDPMSADIRFRDNVQMMGPFDWGALLFASTIVALAVVGELKDIELCRIAIARAGEKLSPRLRLAFNLLGGLRRWVFLPSLVMSIPLLVMVKGGDALSISFNSVAVLFLCEIDNIAFSVGLGERVRSKFEQFGAIKLEDEEYTALVHSKAAHVTLIVLAVLASVSAGADAAKPERVGDSVRPNVSALLLFASPLYVFWLGGVAEAVSRQQVNGGPACVRILQNTGAWFGGLVGVGVLAIVCEQGAGS